jgi:hypothetical protein
VRRPDPEAGDDGGEAHPDRRARLVAPGLVERRQGDGRGEQANDARDDDEAQIMLLDDA